jgi:hypothetical protein
MEPLDDHELKGLVPAWKAPEAPQHLHRQIFGAPRQSWWAWLLTGGIRVPVPACAAIVLLVAWLALGRGSDAQPVLPTAAGQTVVTLADFRPPAEIQVKLVGAWP